MTIDVTVFVNNLIASNPNVSANVKKGVSSATALFSAAQSGGVNVSQLSSLDSTVATASIAGISGGTNALQAGISGVVPAASNTNTAPNNQNLGPDQAQKETFSKGANRSLLDEADAPVGTPLVKVNDDIPILLQSEVRALMIQIAYMETEYKTDYNSDPYYGRYAVHNRTLEAYGYKKGSEWTSKDGITGLIDFIFDSKVQDRIMEKFIKDQYRALIKAGAIRPGDSKQTVAGLLATAYQFQDASPIAAGDLSSLTGSLTNMVSGATSSLTAGQTGIGQATSVLGSSDTMKSTGEILQGTVNNPTLNSTINNIVGSLKSSAGTDPTAAAASVSVTGIKDLISKTNTSAESLKSSATDVFPESKQSQLKSVLTNAADAAKLQASKVDVSSLQAGASDFYNSLPANKTKAWRLNGKEKDSKGRPGSLFYNAGRYAVQSLAADKG